MILGHRCWMQKHRIFNIDVRSPKANSTLNVEREISWKLLFRQSYHPHLFKNQKINQIPSYSTKWILSEKSDFLLFLWIVKWDWEMQFSIMNFYLLKMYLVIHVSSQQSSFWKMISRWIVPGKTFKFLPLHHVDHSYAWVFQYKIEQIRYSEDWIEPLFSSIFCRMCYSKWFSELNESNWIGSGFL